MGLRFRSLAVSFLILCAVAGGPSGDLVCPEAAAAEGGASLGLAWDASTDDSVVGYKIHYGVESGKYTETIQVRGRLTSKAVVENLEEGKTYYFSITAYDAKGKESALSSEVTNHPGENKAPASNSKITKPTAKSKGSDLNSKITKPTANNHAVDTHEPSRPKMPPSRTVTTTPEGKILPIR